MAEYHRAFPEARILVVDNGSTDGTASAALAASAEVIQEARRGKARAVATALNLIDEDLVLMVDGDGVIDDARLPNGRQTCGRRVRRPTRMVGRRRRRHHSHRAAL